MEWEVTLGAVGDHMSQGRAVARVDGREVLSVNAALGTDELEIGGIWVERPDVAPRRLPGAGPSRQVPKLAIKHWFDKITNYHLARVSNGPTEALNNLIKRIKRIGFGFRNFENYRIRALLYAGKPNWRVLGSIVVR